MLNHRKDPRVRPHPTRPVEVQLMGSDFLELLHARDVSVGGIGVVVKHLFAGCDIDHDVDVIVSLPGEKPCLVRGTIRHVVAPGVGTGYFGVQLTAVPPAFAQRLAQYVARRQAEGGGV